LRLQNSHFLCFIWHEVLKGLLLSQSYPPGLGKVVCSWYNSPEKKQSLLWVWRSRLWVNNKLMTAWLPSLLSWRKCALVDTLLEVCKYLQTYGFVLFIWSSREWDCLFSIPWNVFRQSLLDMSVSLGGGLFSL